MASENNTFFNIEIEIESKKTHRLLVTQDTLLENIRNKIGDNIELIHNGTILDDGITLGELGITENYDIIYAFYTVDNKTHDLINIFQNIIETYTQPNGLPLNHYHNIFNSILNIHSTNYRNMGNGVPTNVPTNAPTNENENINNNINDYTEELAALNNLGFDSNEENRLLLQLYNGNVNYVANLLLEQ
jgi:hypothetical protein